MSRICFHFAGLECTSLLNQKKEIAERLCEFITNFSKKEKKEKKEKRIKVLAKELEIADENLFLYVLENELQFFYGDTPEKTLLAKIEKENNNNNFAVLVGSLSSLNQGGAFYRFCQII